jgi:hypothetical protein
MSKQNELVQFSRGASGGGSKNVIINGAMMLSQRQTSSSNVGNQYVLDRFYVYKQNTGSTYTCSQNSVTDLAGFANSLKMDCTTADTSTASNEEVYIQTKLEGQDLQRFQKGHSTALGFTLSFYVKTNKSGVYTVKMYDRDNNRDVSGSYTVADANWNRYTINFPADTTGKFDDDNASSLEIFFSLVRGSDTTGGTLNTAWRTNSDASSASGQVNFADSTSNNWEITGIQLEANDNATDFEHRSFGDEIQACRRYYHKQGATYGHVVAMQTSTSCYSNPTFPVEMRAAPAVDIDHANINLYVQGARTTSADFAQNIQPRSFQFHLQSSGASAGDAGHIDAPTLFYTADAEL